MRSGDSVAPGVAQATQGLSYVSNATPQREQRVAVTSRTEWDMGLGPPLRVEQTTCHEGEKVESRG